MLRRTSFLIGLGTKKAIKPEASVGLVFNREAHEKEMDALYDPCSPRNLEKARSFSHLDPWTRFAEQVKHKEQFLRNNETATSYSESYQARTLK